MPHVVFSPYLAQDFPDLRDGFYAGDTVAQVVASVDRDHPGLAGYLVDDGGALRPRVTAFIGSRAVEDRTGLSDPVEDADDLYFLRGR